MKKLTWLVFSFVLLFSTCCGFAEESIPLIPYEESVLYAGQTVMVDCVFGFDHGSSRDVWYKTIEGYQYEQELSRDMAIGMNDHLSSTEKQYMREPEQGVVHRITMRLYDDGSMGGSSIVEYEVLSEFVDIDELVREYKESCQEISVKTILRNEKDYEGKTTYVRFKGEVLQVIEDYFGPSACLLAVENYESVVYLEYSPDDNDMKMLESDKIEVYGYIPPFKVTETYNTLFGQETVPYVSVEFWDLVED